jgi:WD repeat-containing protein 91
MNISAADGMVQEYLIYRGFTQSFKTFEGEKTKDKTKNFDVQQIVDSVFAYMSMYDIQNFIALWDFLTKRFFLHLDGEHSMLAADLKSDLIKYYLAYCVKSQRKDKVDEFFSMYSHEILAESGRSIPGNLRGWFVLPYMDAPQEDPEFAIYFKQTWTDSVKVTMNNFLSIVLRTAPPPKLLLLERWFRSEAQQGKSHCFYVHVHVPCLA